MNCDEVQARLSEYLEKSLPPGTIKDTEEHLASCARCRAEAESLGDCMRRIASLPEVDPPLGFTQRVMARVRESEAKPAPWERLLFPFRTKVAMQAATIVLISIMALYLFEEEPRRQETEWTLSDREFSSLEKNTQEPAPLAPSEIDALRQTEQSEGSNDRVSRGIQAPPSESKPKAAEQGVSQGRGEESAALQDRRDFAKPEPESFAARLKKSTPDADESSGARPQSKTKELRGGSAGDAVSQPKEGFITEQPAASSPASPDSLGRSRAGSLSPASNFEKSQAMPDVDFVVRRAQSVEAQGRQSLEGLRALSERETATKQENARLGRLLPAIPESTQSQDVWLTIPRAQYDQLKKELLAIGAIESESWLGSDKKDGTYRANDQLRIKVTVLPPVSEKRPPTSGSDR
jgi:hypothetical protein